MDATVVLPDGGRERDCTTSENMLIARELMICLFESVRRTFGISPVRSDVTHRLRLAVAHRQNEYNNQMLNNCTSLDVCMCLAHNVDCWG